MSAAVIKSHIGVHHVQSCQVLSILKKKLTQVEIISYLLRHFVQRPLGNRWLKENSLYALGPSKSNEYLLGKRLVVLICNFTVIRNLTSLSKSANGRISRNIRVSLSEQDIIATSTTVYEGSVAKHPWFPLYLTTHNNHNRQTSMPPAGFEPAIPASEWP